MAEKNKEKEKGKRYFLWFILFLLSIYLFITIQERRGYCFDKGEYVHNLYTEQELIDKGIEYVISNMPSWALTTENVYLEAKRYSNIEEFKIKNSNCCELTNFINEGDGDISKDTYGYIRVEYFIHYIQSVPADKQIFYLEYTPCGELKGIVDTFTR